MDAQKNQQTDEILNAILPPRYMVVLSACTGTLSVADKGEGRGPGATVTGSFKLKKKTNK